MAKYNHGIKYNTQQKYNDPRIYCNFVNIISEANVDCIASVIHNGKSDIFGFAKIRVRAEIVKPLEEKYKYLNYYRNENLEVIFKIELLDKNDNVIETIESDIIDGSVNYALQNGQRRTANITLMNLDNKYTPNPKGLIWLNTKFKILCGIKVDNKEYFNSSGIFVLYEPTINSFFTDTTASFSLNDKWSFLNGDLGGNLSSDYIVPVGINIGNVVKDIITLSGDKQSPIIIPTNITSPYTLTIDRGNNYADLLIKLAEMISYDIYYDENGILRFQPPVDDKLQPSKWDFSTDEVTYLGSARKYEFNKIKNSVYVYGDNINGNQVSGIAQDNYIFSSTNVGLIGERPLVITDDIIYTDDLALQRANYELKKAIILQEIIDTDCMPIYHLKEGETVTIKDDGNGLNRDRYLIQNGNIPLKYDGTMKLNLWKFRELE